MPISGCNGIASLGNMQISNSSLCELSKCWVYSSAVNHPWWMSMLFHRRGFCEKTRPESWPGDYMGKAAPFWQLSLPTAATKCNRTAEPSHRNAVGGKACSSTKGGLLRYILNTYSIHKVSSLKFAYFQGRLSRHITSPSEKTPPESWPRDYMGKATPFWQLSSSHRCHQM